MIGVPAIVGLLAASAAGAEVALVPQFGELRSEVATEVRVLVLGDDGQPLEGPLEVRPSAGVWVRIDGEAVPGMARFVATTPAGIDAVSVRVLAGEVSQVLELPVREGPLPTLRIRSLAHEGDPRAIRFAVEGHPLPEASQLQIVTSEGRVSSIERAEDRLTVTLAVEDVRFARLVVVGVRDAHSEVPPTFGVLRVRQRTEVPVESQPGTTVSLEVGGRRTSPVVIPATGRVVVPVEHGPEDGSGRIHLVDVFGNEATYPFPLPGQLVPKLVGVVSGPAYTREAPPDMVLYGIRGDGRPWTREPPSCRSSSLGELPIVRLQPGTWRVRLPARVPEDVWEVRVRCNLGDEADTTVVLPLAESVPVALDLKVWPEVLSADLPVANLQVALLNVLGERVEARGTFSVKATLGEVTVDGRKGPALRAEYTAQVAVEVGEDQLEVAYRREAGEGPVDRVLVVGGLRRGERGLVHVRALDDQRRPLAGRRVAVEAGGEVVPGTTGADGWATLDVPAPDTIVRLVVRSEQQVRHDAVLIGGGYRWGPGQPDLTLTRTVRVDPGRVAEVDLQVVPRLLRPGPRAEALVRAQLLDREGLLARAEMPTMSTSEGVLAPLGQAEDGAWEWRYLPPPGFRARSVEIVARNDVLDVEERAEVNIRPAPMRRWLGVGAGMQTNFGRIVSPYVSAEGEWRIRLSPREDEERAGPTRFVGRLGVGWYGAQATTVAVPTVEGTVRMDLLPIQALLGVRVEYPVQSAWFEVGGVVAPFIGSASYGGVIVTRRVGVLPPGFVVAAGYGVRVPGGEVAVELRGTVLTSPGSDISFEGQVGGLSATLAYRVFYGGRISR